MSQTTDRYNCRSAYPNSDLCRLFPPACVFSQLRFTWGGEFYDFLYQERELTIWYSMPFAKLTKKKQCKTDRLLILLWLGLYSDVFCMCCYFRTCWSNWIWSYPSVNGWHFCTAKNCRFAMRNTPPFYAKRCSTSCELRAIEVSPNEINLP